MNLVRRFSIAVILLLAGSSGPLSLLAQDGAEPPAPATTQFSDTEKAGLKTLDDAIARFDALLATVTDVHEKAAVKSFLDSLKDRRFQVRPGYDSSIFDNLRLDVEIEYQRLVAWLAPIKPTRSTRRDITIPLPLVATTTGASAANQLSAAEKQGGWQLLFDGKTLNGWRGYGRKELPKLEFGWVVKDGVLHAVPTDKVLKLPFAKVREGELITEKKYNDFELSWDWRVPKGANSGLKYFVTEDRPSAPGVEFQMFDDLGNAKFADPARNRVHDTGGFYEVIAPAKDIPLRAAGEWNTSRILVRGNHVEHWHNGKLVMSCELGSAEVKAGIAKSKFKEERGFGEKIAGHIMLNYHGDEAWVKNFKIRELK